MISNVVYGIELSDFSNEIKKYRNEYFPELNEIDLSNNTKDVEELLNIPNLLKRLLLGITGEFKNNITLILKVIGISILCVVLKSIQSSFGENGIGEVAFYVCYILIIILIMTSFTNIINQCRDTIDSLSKFMEYIIPIVIGMLAVTGKITTIAIIQPVILTMISLISILLTNIIIPAIFISTVINIISNISEKVNVKRIGTLMNKGSLWLMEIILILFVGVISLEGTLASNVDGLTAKLGRNVVSTTVPVVGKLLGDAVDSVIGGINVTKTAFGTIGIIAIISITIVPLIRTLILMISFGIASAIVEPVTDNRIVKCMSGMSESIKTLFAIMATTMFLFIISVSIIIKVTNI